MPRISPFVGLLFDRSHVASLDDVTTPPYDVISQADRRRYLDASPYNVVRLVIGEEHSGDDEGSKYMRAASELERWRASGVLRPTERPCYFPYQMDFAFHGRPRRTRGVIAAVELEDWGGSVIPHERTMSWPVEDRLRLTRAIRANLSCIHVMLAGPNDRLAAFLEAAASDAPAAEAADEEGVRHRLWACPEEDGIAEALEGERLMIADGHHRYTMYLRYRDEMRERHGPGPWDRVMMLIVDAATEQPPVLPFHRVLTADGSVPRAPDRSAARVRDLEEVLDAVDDEALRYGVVALEDGVLVHRVAALEGQPPTVCALHEQILGDVEDSLRFTHDPVEAEDAVKAGSASAAYLLPSSSTERIRAVVERGGRLPQKSTFFWPKPRTGLVIRPLD